MSGAHRARIAAALAGDGAARLAALAEIGALAPGEAAALVDAALAAAVVETLASPSRSEQRLAAETMAPLANALPAIEHALDAALDDPRQRLRWGAAFTLGRARASRPGRLWPATREAMALHDGDQRWAATELATRLARADDEVADGLREAAGDDSPVLRRMALYGLRDLAAPDLGDAARQALEDVDAKVRLAALAALVAAPGDDSQRARSAVLVASRVAADPDPGVRRAAAATLGRLGVSLPEVTTALAAAAESTDEALARAALAAGRQLGGEPAAR